MWLFLCPLEVWESVDIYAVICFIIWWHVRHEVSLNGFMCMKVMCRDVHTLSLRLRKWSSSVHLCLWKLLNLSLHSGLPKAATVTHERVWAASFIQGVSGVTSEDVFYLNLPLYHSAGFLIGFIGCIERGTLLYIIPPPFYFIGFKLISLYNIIYNQIFKNWDVINQ